MTIDLDFVERQAHYEKIKKLVTSIIQEKNIESLKMLIEETWSLGEVINNKEWFMRERILKKTNIDEISGKLAILIGEDENKKKLNSIPGIGQATTTEILHSFYPAKYPIWNKRSENLIKKLDVTLVFPRTSDSWKKYRVFIRGVNKLLPKFSDWKKEMIDIREPNTISNYEFFDSIASYLWDKNNSYDCLSEIKKKIENGSHKINTIDNGNTALSITLINLINSMEKQNKDPKYIVNKIKLILGEFIN